MKKLEMGLVQVYIGTGKGKSCSSLGQALRAAGHGFRIYICHFSISGSRSDTLHMEEAVSPKLLRNIRIETFELSEYRGNVIIKPDNSYFRDILQDIRKIIESGIYDIVILDEILQLVSLELISEEDVISLIDIKPYHTELILTGREKDKVSEIIRRSHLVTEYREIKAV